MFQWTFFAILRVPHHVHIWILQSLTLFIYLQASALGYQRSSMLYDVSESEKNTRYISHEDEILSGNGHVSH